MTAAEITTAAATRAGRRTARHHQAGWLAAAVGVAALMTGCAPLRSVTPWRGDRWDRETVTAEARLLQLVDARRPDTLLVDALLVGGPTGRQARLALAIGQLKMRARYPLLRAWVSAADSSLAASAAFALGIGRDTAGIPELAAALSSVGARSRPTVAAEAAWALGEIGEPARQVVETALGAEGACSARGTLATATAPCAMLLLASAKLRPVPAGRVVPWLSDTDPSVVRAAAYALARSRVPSGVVPMMAVDTHPDEEVRQHVARLLVRGVVSDSLAARARTLLEGLAADASERVRANAARSLSTYGPVAAPVMWRLLADPSRNVRVAAVDSLHLVLEGDPVGWRRAWEADSSEAVRRPLQTLARRLGLVIPGAPAVLPAGGAAGAMRAPLPESWGPIGARDRPLADYEGLVRRFMQPGAPAPRAMIETEHGAITVELFAREAPLVVEAFLHLAAAGLYRDTRFHRVVPNFVAQDGDIGLGGGGRAGFTLRESWTRRRHGRGCLGLATAGPDTGGSQYYFCHSSQPHLDGAYTVFGRVVDGVSAMDAIAQGDRMIRIGVP